MFFKLILHVFLLYLAGIFAAPIFSNNNDNPWINKHALTYSILNNPKSLQRFDVQLAIRKAFNEFTANIPVDFNEISPSQPADIKISFDAGNHGDNNAFDENNAVHSIPFKEIHFDINVPYAINTVGVMPDENFNDFYYMALYGIGSVLGLPSSDKENSIMYRGYKNPVGPDGLYSEPRFTLEDTEAAQSIYERY